MLQNLAEDFELPMIGMIILFYVAIALLFSWLCLSPKTRQWALTFEGVVPPFFGLPAILFSLTVALLATSIWENYNAANKSIRNEALGLTTIIDLAETIPALKNSGLIESAKGYTRSIIEDEWKTLSAHGKPAAYSKKQFEALRSNVFQAVDSLNNNAESKALMNAIQTVNDGRKARLSFVSFDVHPIRWCAIIVLAILTQMVVSLVHISKPKVLPLALGICTTTLLIPICTIALTLSSPYIGMISLSNGPLLAIIQ
jgi:hypothetical protein